MWWINRKVESFSLIELLVVMVLSSIIVSIIYFSFYTVSKYQMTLASKLNGFNDVSELYFLLKKDFERSKTILSADNEHLRCIIERKGIDVEYTFLADNIVRRQTNRTDTFKCKVSTPIFLWQGKEIIAPEINVDELQIELLDGPTSIQLRVHKEYDAASLIETVKNDTTSERN
jgi:prepilin-type N-terminal cleavage/methylation domain-containing protein